MWYAPTVITPAASEPVTVAEAVVNLNMAVGENDPKVEAAIAAARAVVEARTGTRLMEQTVAVKCDGWDDMARLEVAPIKSVSSIVYVDTAGADQTLSTDAWELRADGDTLDPSIVLKYGQHWPATRTGSRITLTAAVGYTVLPTDLKHAVKMLVELLYDQSSGINIGNIVNALPHNVDSLLANHRRGM